MVMQIMSESFILSCIYVIPVNSDLMKAEGQKHVPTFQEVLKYSLK